MFAKDDWKPTLPSSSLQSFVQDAKTFHPATVVGLRKDGLTWRPSLPTCPKPMGESDSVVD